MDSEGNLPSEELSLIEKVLFVEIYSLDNERLLRIEQLLRGVFLSERSPDSEYPRGAHCCNDSKQNERVIRTIGGYRRISMEEKQEVFQQKRQTAAGEEGKV